MFKFVSRLATVICVLTTLTALPSRADDDLLSLSKTILIGSPTERQSAVDALVARGGTDMIPSLVLLMRIGGSHVVTQQALRALTGERLTTWREAMHYQEAHPEIAPHPSYYDLKLWYWGGIDPGFLSFFDTPIKPSDMRIRFEEITWGGALADGIPSLDKPALIKAAEADYLADTDLVFGVEINGDARAYPLRIMGWHEMFNEVIGGVPVALAYCTLCGAGILFESQVDDSDTPFVFGSSGLLYRSNKLMFDRQTNSLWNQFTGEPVSGTLARSGITLKIRPSTITSWGDWRRLHPTTQVLSLETGHFRNYDSGVVYRDYFASPDLLYPTITDQTRLAQKDQVYGIRVAGGTKAWPLAAFTDEPVINDEVGFSNIVLIGDATTQTVRAYERGALSFSGSASRVTGPGGDWQITEDALIGPNGQSQPRIPGHIAYWFAWDGYLGAESALYESPS
ncbi:DUF3179 domain-containing protein [Rhodobacteraceae bacterium]|nr:DUF3179 domain-containing protein [Paracoccaceae bacterium]